MEKWGICSLRIEDAPPQADTFMRGVYVPAPRGSGPSKTKRVLRLRPPAHALNDAPAAFDKTPHAHPLGSKATLARVGHVVKVSPFDFCPTKIKAQNGVAAGAHATRVDDILGRGAVGDYLSAPWGMVGN